MRSFSAEENATFAKLLKLIDAPPQPSNRDHSAVSCVNETNEHATAKAPAAEPPTIPASSAPKADPPPSTPESPNPPQSAGQANPASEAISPITRCTNAYSKARADAFARSQSRYAADEAGAKAYRRAMPPLLGAENIREFIACVAHGMLLGAIENKDASKLLYAAQVAFSARNLPNPKPASNPEPDINPSASRVN